MYKQDFYNLVTSYFDNPIMTKINQWEGISYYYVKKRTQTITDNYYIIVGVQGDTSELHTRKYLKNLQWCSLLTRKIKDNYPVNFTTYNSNNVLNNIFISQIERQDNYTTYLYYPLDIKISVFHEDSSKRFPKQTTLNLALEEFNTIIKI